MIVRLILFGLLLSILAEAGTISGAVLFHNNKSSRVESMPDADAPDYNLSEQSVGLYSTQSIQKNFDEGNGFKFEMDENGSYKRTGDLNLSLPTNLKEFFKYRSKGNNGATVINNMGQNNEVSRDIYGTDPSKFTRSYLQLTHEGSKEANISLRAESLSAQLKSKTAKSKYIKCYAKRKLLPQYFCPIPGMENGSRVGGEQSDDSMSTQRYCNDYCISPNSYGCRSANTGQYAEVSKTATHVFKWDKDDVSFSVSFNINDKLKLKGLSYDKTVTINKEKTTEHDFDLAPMKMRYRMEYLDKKDHWQYLVTNYSMNLQAGFERVMLTAIPDAKKVKITFFHPTLESTSIYKDKTGDDFLKQLVLENFKISYYDDKYYFCNIDQVIFDVASECRGGKIYTMTGDNGSFKVCVQRSGIKGPEETYNAFYTKESCDQACRIRMDCVQTFDRFSYRQITDPSAFSVEVGCVDEPSNSNCSPNTCKELYRGHKLPNTEIVYSPEEGSKMTVVSGSEIPGTRRPKIDLDGEESAIGSGNYDDVFTESMKDVAFENMIKKGTYNYIGTTVSENTETENAYERIVMKNESPYKPTNIGINWLYKPSAWQVGDAKTYKLYLLAKIEVIYRPVSGTFYMKGGLETTYSSDNFPFFKDEIYAVKRSDGIFEPFYIREYAFIQDSNLSDTEWRVNAQHINARYIRYDANSDSYKTASESEILKYFKTTKFSGGKNWETFRVVDDMANDFYKGSNGMVFVRQETNSFTQLPIKKWRGATDTDSAATLGRIRLYGLVAPSSSSAQASQGRKAIDDPDKMDHFLFYDTAAYSLLSDTIQGDGVIKDSGIKLFAKGNQNNLSVAADIKPDIQNEGKDAILFMYLYKKENK